MGSQTISEIKFVENYSDFENIQGFQLNVTKINQQRQTIVVIVCISKSMALTIPNVANVFTELNPSKGI